ncbi:MAG: DNA polymerase IV [Phycisphaerales bacterium]|nr:DNA polymerase IV [Phycisphaerales bacterium]
MPWPGRIIMHVDMDAFFASVEQRDKPALRGKPVLVGGSSRRGVVAAASYESRKFGCRSAMPMAQALRLCPTAIVVKGNYGKYSAASKAVFEVLRSFTPDVQPISVDEAFMEMTGALHIYEKQWGISGLSVLERIGRAIKQRIREAVDLPASVGISGNKFLAKLSSDLSKPDGLKILDPRAAETELAFMPVGVIYGLGPKTQDRLRQIEIKTIADLRAFGEERLVSRFGEQAREWLRLSRGEDHRPVRLEREQKSIGKERTFFDNIADPDELRTVLLGFTEEVARSLREDGLTCRGVTLKLRLGDFSTFTRSATLGAPTDSTKAIWAVASDLLAKWLNERRGALRLMGVSLHGLSGEEQLDLFASVPARDIETRSSGKQKKVDKATDAIIEKFGRGSIKRGGSLRDD